MIYLISSSKYIKIGYSSDFKKRFEQYSTCNPDFKVLDIFNEGTLKDEANLHKALSEYAYRGEWMYYNDEVINTWNNYTGHSVQTLSDIEKSKYEKEIESLTKRVSEAEFNKDCANYCRYTILKDLSLVYKESDKLYNYIETLLGNKDFKLQELLYEKQNQINENNEQLIKLLLDRIKVLEQTS